ncbi:MAG: hypothetical protein II278_00525 [Bacteroidaceae bacterium]|nr:hypothetical protein [Bacteroidaceae bacterium]
MTVRELIVKLQQCSPDAIVCAEANRDCLANVVQEYAGEDGKHYVYVADELDYIDTVILGKKV